MMVLTVKGKVCASSFADYLQYNAETTAIAHLIKNVDVQLAEACPGRFISRLRKAQGPRSSQRSLRGGKAFRQCWEVVAVLVPAALGHQMLL